MSGSIRIRSADQCCPGWVSLIQLTLPAVSTSPIYWVAVENQTFLSSPSVGVITIGPLPRGLTASEGQSASKFVMLPLGVTRTMFTPESSAFAPRNQTFLSDPRTPRSTVLLEP